MFSLRLLGGASVETPSGPLSGRPAQRRRLALLALLAAAGARGMAREKVIFYLWPESGTDRARRLLSDTVYVLNRALAGKAVLSSGDELRLNPAALRSDLGEFQAALESGDHERALRVYAGPLLDGFFVGGAPEFDQWVEGERERLSRMYARALETLADQRAAEGDHPGAVERWRRLSAHDPYSSRVALRLIQALDAAGERAAALQHARLYAARLREELGADPDPEVMQLAERLRSAPTTREIGREASGPMSGPRASADEGFPSIAVLPFVNISGDPAQEYFSDGITEELISTLSRMEGLRVAARTSSFAFKGVSADVGEIGRKLRVKAMLEGSVRASGTCHPP